jgi:hypothetical protein
MYDASTLCCLFQLHCLFVRILVLQKFLNHSISSLQAGFLFICLLILSVCPWCEIILLNSRDIFFWIKVSKYTKENCQNTQSNLRCQNAIDLSIYVTMPMLVGSLVLHVIHSMGCWQKCNFTNGMVATSQTLVLHDWPRSSPIST